MALAALLECCGCLALGGIDVGWSGNRRCGAVVVESVAGALRQMGGRASPSSAASPRTSSIRWRRSRPISRWSPRLPPSLSASPSCSGCLSSTRRCRRWSLPRPPRRSPAASLPCRRVGCAGRHHRQTWCRRSPSCRNRGIVAARVEKIEKTVTETAKKVDEVKAKRRRSNRPGRSPKARPSRARRPRLQATTRMSPGRRKRSRTRRTRSPNRTRRSPRTRKSSSRPPNSWPPKTDDTLKADHETDRRQRGKADRCRPRSCRRRPRRSPTRSRRSRGVLTKLAAQGGIIADPQRPDDSTTMPAS